MATELEFYQKAFITQLGVWDFNMWAFAAVEI